ncbi:MAG: RNA-binding protein [Bacteroidetes bacterium]|nr:RNA-binding protein [Bacteroidota bacterium]
MNIFVGNLNFQTTESQLQELFEGFGQVNSVKIPTDSYTNRSRGFGFVEMRDQQHAEQAIEKLNGSSFDKKTIVVNEARPRTERRDNFSGRNSDRGYNKRY